MDPLSSVAAQTAAIGRLFFLVALLGFSSFSQAWTDWLVPEAALRFRLARPHGLGRPYTLRLDIPREFSAYAVAGAYAGNGTALPARPIRLNTNLTAVEISLDPLTSGSINVAGATDKTKFPDHAPVFVYLAEAGKDTVKSLDDRTPVAWRVGRVSSITRPSGVNDLLTFWSRNSALSFREDRGLNMNPDLAVPTRPSRKLRHRRNNSCAQLEYSTSLIVREKSVFRFGAATAKTAWFIFVNGQGVAAWRTGKAETGAVLGDKVTLSPGIYPLSVFAIVRPDETFPDLLYTKNGGKPVAFSPDQVAASHLPTASRLEFRQGNIHPGVAIDGGVIYLPGLREFCHTVMPTDLTWVTGGDLPDTPTTFTVNNQPAGDGHPVAASGMPPRELIVGGSFPGKQFTLTIPVFPQRPAAVYLGELAVLKLPPMVTKTGTIDIRVKLHNASINQETKIPGFVPVLRINLVGADNKIRQVMKKPINHSDSLQTITVPVNSDIARVVLDVSLGGVNIVQPVTVEILRPSSDLSQIVADGDRLRSGPNLAVLQIDGEIPPVSPPPLKPHTLPLDAVVVWVDTYMAKGAAAEQLSTHLSTGQDKTPYSLIRVDDRDLPKLPVLPELRQFHLAARALSMQPAAIIWGIGPLDLAAGTHRDEIQRRQQFFIQASLARGILPVLVTPPLLAGMDHEETRAAALSIKRLGLQLGLPVADVFSEARALKTRPAGASFNEFTHLDPAVNIDGVNAAGRSWSLQLVRRTLDKILKK